ncbi:MAG: DNA recombination protein RmuC [Endomicrobium sp.]|jgi:DNA recombination protein RmuC|nr:DNA recombination protein RmuC [Endomicrobium sp.]
MSVLEMILLSSVAVLVITVLLITIFKKAKVDENELAKFSIAVERMDSLIRNEFSRNRNENQEAFKISREELSNTFKGLGEILANTIKDFNELHKQKFDDLINRHNNIKKETEDKLKEIRETVEKKLTDIQTDNNKKLEDMRKIVDEKLQESVEKRFNESFKLISERLDAVHKGLGEMSNLASGVGDLKKVLTNVKTRGIFGEVHLGAILEQFLSPEQYVKNDHPDADNDKRVVEYSIKLPGKDANEPVFLPIDSKFPLEDYQRLVEAYDKDPDSVETISKQLRTAIEKSAKDISDKYIKPPKTTDFAILFVPTEGLYAEILRHVGLFENLQNKYRVIVVGPTNLVAFLNSLQMGFKTLSIQKRSSEVWKILGAVKTEFGKFNDVLEKVKKNLESGIRNIDDAVGTRANVMMNKLKNIDALPEDQSAAVLETAVPNGNKEDKEEEFL